VAATSATGLVAATLAVTVLAVAASVAAASVAASEVGASVVVLAAGANRRRQACPAQHVAVHSFYKEKSEQ
jgi:hypothetical protein